MGSGLGLEWGDGSATHSRNVYMPANEFGLNADFMVPSDVFSGAYFPCHCRLG